MNDKLQRFKKGEIVLNTPTKALYDKLMQWCKKEGIWWANGREATQQSDSWTAYKENLCIRAWDGDLVRDNASYYREHRYTVVALTEQDFEFTKDDLKTGMVVKLRNGGYFIVMKNADKIIGINSWQYIPLDVYNNDMSIKDKRLSTSFEIVNISQDKDTRDNNGHLAFNDFFDTVYQCKSANKADEINKTIDTLTKQLEEYKKKLGGLA